MPYRPRELVMRAREAAARLLAALDRNEMVPRFLDVYAAEFRRPGRADHPVQYREQLQSIRREAILAMVFRIESSLPKRLKVSVTVRAAKKRAPKSKRAKGKSKPRKKPSVGMEMGIPFLDLFREEFFVALGQWLEWSEKDAEEFWRDLEFYEKLTPITRSKSAKAARQNISGPFVDRVAMVLDPSLMEQARREAAKFQVELNGAADRLLQKVFRVRRE